MTWRVVRRHRTPTDPGTFVVRVSTAEASGQRLAAEWDGDTPPSGRRPDAVRLTLPRLGRRQTPDARTLPPRTPKDTP